VTHPTRHPDRRPFPRTSALAFLMGTIACVAPTPAAAPPSAAAEPVRHLLMALVDRGLGERQVRVVGITPAAVLVLDDAGRTIEVSRAGLLAIVPPLPDAWPTGVRREIVWRELTALDEGPGGMLETADGQRLPGHAADSTFGDPASAADAPADPDTLLWRSTLWGPIPVALDDVRSLTISSEATPTRPATDPAGATTLDTLLLLNGDVLAGFVERVTPDVAFEVDGRAATIPLDRVASILFANAIRGPVGPRAWLADGTIAAIGDVALAGGALALTGPAPASPWVDRPAADLRAVAFDAAAFRPLADLVASPAAPSPPQVSAGAPAAGRRWTPPVVAADGRAEPLGAADVELPGPMTTQWAMPAGAVRFAAVAELPASCRIWGDLELVVVAVAADGALRPLARHRLHPAEPRVVLNAAIDGAASLRMTVVPGPSGPIQDRVLLRRALVSIAP